jgi:very-short-patch-repair endonuclease
MTTPDRAASPALRLAQYLKEFVGLRSKTVREVGKYESVLWFSDMPQESDCESGAWTDDLAPETPWLEVKKQTFQAAPKVPEAIAAWANISALQKATPEIPELLTSILILDKSTEPTEEEPEPKIEVFLSDHPDVQALYKDFTPAWEQWSETTRKQEAIQAVYSELFRLHTQLRKQAEIVELVLGVGLLSWRGGKGVPINRHSVVANVELEFVPKQGVIRVLPPKEGADLRIEDDMLEAEVRPDREAYSQLQAQLEEVGDELWDKELLHPGLKAWAEVLDSDSIWSSDLSTQTSTEPRLRVAFAPAIILRKRSQTGMLRIYEGLIEQLTVEGCDLPTGWEALVDDLPDNDGQSETADDDPRGSDSQVHPPQEVYFPLPANREQRQIVDAIERQRGVLVQGPPGTGKSHTIANLICHLLATGKRVLITAETGHALQVLKDKLPQEIRPLCVSLLGQGGDSFAELNSSVQDITRRQASFSESAATARVEELESELDGARRLRAKTDSELRSMREDETCSHSRCDGHYIGTASKIAARISDERDQFNWLSLTDPEGGTPGLDPESLRSWLSILRESSAAVLDDAHLRIPSTEHLPSPQDFIAAVQSESAASQSNSAYEELRKHPAYAPLSKLEPSSLSAIADGLTVIEAERLLVSQAKNEWIKRAVSDAVSNRAAIWKSLLDQSSGHLDVARTALNTLGGVSVEIPQCLNRRKVRSDAIAVAAHFTDGGSWKRFGFLTPPEVKGRTYLRTEVLVDGAGANDALDMNAIHRHVDLEEAIDDLSSAWASIGTGELPSDHGMRLAVIEEYCALLNQVLELGEQCQAVSNLMRESSTPIPEPDWREGEGGYWLELVNAAQKENALIRAKETLEQGVKELIELQGLHNPHDIVTTLADAVRTRDTTTYSKGHEELVELERLREGQEFRGRIEARLSEVSPELIAVVTASCQEEHWDRRFEELVAASKWAATDTWLTNRMDPGYQRKLEEKREITEDRIGCILADLASEKAWMHFFARLTTKETASLKSWREAIRAMGKGTGKSAKMARLRKEARQYMDQCRDAIPVWIMPRYLVAEMVDPAPGRYDLVIVDEASQLGIESLFLFYIANKMVVVGDDQQISPYGIGVSDDAIAGLQQHYLDDIPHRHALSAQSSLYGNAKIRFSRNIVLREHFRCMPEIIQFSNDLCYASNGTPLDPLRTYPANRLTPLVTRHIPDGYRKGSSQNAENPPEAEAIVRQIVACVQDPRYANASMGVISLQGQTQAKLIERELHAALDPEVIEERNLICGDAYAFQGDERTVIFLSLVAAPGERRIGSLSNESARQRFNVAVSRAKDQLWLFHTAELEVLSDKCMRHRLLSYMQNPTRRLADEADQVFDSKFERNVFRMLTDREFHVRTQVCVGDPTNHRYRIDLVVEGMQGRLAVECDGDHWHGPERYEHDMARQRDLERAGWQFARIRGSVFYRDRIAAMVPVWEELDRLGIKPGGLDETAGDPPAPADSDTEAWLPSAVHIPDVDADSKAPQDTEDVPEESPVQSKSPAAPAFADIGKAKKQSDTQQELISNALPDLFSPPEGEAIEVCLTRSRYVEFEGPYGPDPREAKSKEVADGLIAIIASEGPMLAKRAYDIYLRGCGLKRMGKDLKSALNRALQTAIAKGQVHKEDETGKGGLLFATVRSSGAPSICLRDRGTRSLEEIPPSELQLAARLLLKDGGFVFGAEEHLRATMEDFNLKRLTPQAKSLLKTALSAKFDYVTEALKNGAH